MKTNTPLPDEATLLHALITAWELEGNPLGTDRHLQIFQLLDSLGTVEPERLKTLLAPILADSKEAQYAFYQLFDQVLAAQQAAQQRHKQTAQEALQADREDRRRKWLLQVKANVLDRLKGLDAWRQLFPLQFLLLTSGFILLIVLSLVWLLSRAGDTEVPPLRELLIPSGYETRNADQHCFVMNKSGPALREVALIEPAQKHFIRTDWAPDYLCVSFLRKALGTDTVLYEIRTSDNKKHHFRFIFQPTGPPPPSWEPPQENRIQWRVGPDNSTPAKNTPSLANPDFPKLTPIDSTQKLFDSAYIVHKPTQYASNLSSAWHIGVGYAFLTPDKWILIGCLGLLLWGIGAWRNLRRRQYVLKRQQDAKAPHTWTLRIPYYQSLPMHDSFYRAATEMRRRLDGLLQQLDMKATVKATVEQAGMIQFRHRQLFVSKHYLILLDRQSFNDHQIRLLEELCLQWKANEVSVDLFFFNEDPCICRNNRYPEGLDIQELSLKYPEHRLMIWGNGHGLLQPDTGLPQPWIRQFDHWRKRLIFSSRPATVWDAREDQLAQHFRLLPMSVQHFGELAESIESLQAKSHEHWKTVAPQQADHFLQWTPEAEGEALLRLLESEYIHYKNGAPDDRLLQWIAACAIPPVLSWDWTLFVGDKLSGKNEHFFNAEHLFSIIRLPWFWEEKMPVAIQSMLMDWLEKHHPAFHEAIRRDWDNILRLEINLPPAGSIAWEGHRIQVLFNQLILKPKQKERSQLEKELDHLLASGAHDQSLIIDYVEKQRQHTDNLLSARFRKFVQVKKGIFWHWRDWVWQLPVWLSLSLSIALVHHNEPVRTINLGESNTIRTVAVSSDNKYLAISSTGPHDDPAVILCNLADGAWIRGKKGYPGEVMALAFTEDNTHILSATHGDYVSEWNIWGQDLFARKGTSGWVSAAAFDPLNQFILLAHYETGKGVVEILKVTPEGLKSGIRFVAHEDQITKIVLSPQRDAILTGSRDQTLKLWDLDGNLKQTFLGHQDRVHSVAFSPDGNLIFSAGRDNTARMWDRKGRELQVFRGHGSDVYDIQCSPDNKTVLTASEDQTVRLWSMEGKTIRVWDHFYKPVKMACFSADGRKMITACAEGLVKIYEK